MQLAKTALFDGGLLHAKNADGGQRLRAVWHGEHGYAQLSLNLKSALPFTMRPPRKAIAQLQQQIFARQPFNFIRIGSSATRFGAGGKRGAAV